MSSELERCALGAALGDVRQAQQLLVEYYRRVLPLIEQLAQKLAGGSFWWRDINVGDGLGNSSSYPFNRSPWSYLPGADIQFSFRCRYEAESSTTPDGAAKYWTLGIRLITDSQYCLEKGTTQSEGSDEVGSSLLLISAYHNGSWEDNYWPPNHYRGWLTLTDFKQLTENFVEDNASQAPDDISRIGWLTPLETFFNEQATSAYVNERRRELVERGYLAKE